MARTPGTKNLIGPPADEQEVSASAARSELARHWLGQQSASSGRRNGFPLFTVSRDSAPLTPERVKRHGDEH